MSPDTAREAPLRRPDPTEHAAYFGSYIAQVPDGDLLATLARQRDELHALLAPLDASAGRPYAPGKWSVAQVLGHVIDCERIFTTRALCIARGDTTELPGFDADPYAEAAGSDARGLADLLDEHAAVRAATLALFRSLDETALSRVGTADGKRISARALAWLCAGHERHHLRVVRERYMG
ncbi:MAG: DinB family protein [Planctomycetota bacterium]|jgi:uncharacterized damage-inducible protein DinB